MATNPITSESLTVDFRSLMKIPVGDRMKAASINQDFLQSILNALTPIQIANAFPNYYKRQLPDVSNFITSYITSRNGGNFNQTGGGDQGYEPTYYDGEDKPKGKRPRGAPEPTIEEMKKKLIEQGIDVEGTYAALNSGAILEGDDRFGYLQKMSDEELKAAGMQRIQDEYGKTLINLLPTEASTLSDEEVLRRASDKVVSGTTGLEGRAALAKQTYDAFIEAGVSDKQARALVAEVNRENSLRPEYVFGTHTEVAAQAGGRTNYGMFSWGDPSRVKNFKKYMQENGVMDSAGNLIADNSTYLKHQAKFAVQEMQGYESGRKFLENKEVTVEDGTQLLGRYIGWDMAGRRHDARASYDRLAEGRKIIDEVNDKMGKLLPENPTPAQIEEARKILDQKERESRADALIRQQYDKPSPTSSEYVQSPFDKETVTVLHGQADTFASRSSQGVVAAGIDNIDPRLVTLGDASIRAFEKMNPGYTVRVISGKRTEATNSGSPTSRHLRGGAVDYEIVDPDGNVLPNLGGGNSGVRAEAGFYAPKYEELGRYMEAARLKLAKDDPRYAENQVVAGMHFGGNWWMDSMHMQLGGKGALGDLYSGFKSPEQLRKEGQPEVIVKAVENAISAGATHSINEEEMQQLSDFLYNEGVAPIEVIQKVNPVVAEKLQKEIEQKEQISAATLPEIPATEKQAELTNASVAEQPLEQVATPPVSIESKETVVSEILPVPVESKETTAATPVSVETKEPTAAIPPPVSVEPKETTATPPAPPPEEVRKYALGGNIYEPNEDMTLVDTETGNPIAQIGNNEKIEKTGSAIQVTPETKLKAEELTNKYDSSTEMEDRMSNIEDNLQNQKTPDTTNQITQKAREPEKTQTETPYRWRESVASVERPVSPSFNRAMARSKFFGEGHHFTRSAPSSQS